MQHAFEAKWIYYLWFVNCGDVGGTSLRKVTSQHSHLTSISGRNASWRPCGGELPKGKASFMMGHYLVIGMLVEPHRLNEDQC